MEDCVFCKIINKEIPSTIVYEDDEILAFNDASPIAPVHILVVPKKHLSNHLELSQEDSNIISKIHFVINKLAKEKGVDKSGFRIVVNTGEDGRQTVKHLHFHLIGGRRLGVDA